MRHFPCSGSLYFLIMHAMVFKSRKLLLCFVSCFSFSLFYFMFCKLSKRQMYRIRVGIHGNRLGRVKLFICSYLSRLTVDESLTNSELFNRMIEALFVKPGNFQINFMSMLMNQILC